MDKYLNIVSFNIPYPANYGGVIDVYYKLEALRACGVKLILHCFEYERPHAPELESICDKVFYYKRRTGVIANLTWLPYNVYSRKDHRLIENLLQNDYPILFEGLHSCYYMNDPRLRNRMKIFRECNIEHDYYRHLAKSGKGLVRNAFFKIEAMRFPSLSESSTVRKSDNRRIHDRQQTIYENNFPIKGSSSFLVSTRITGLRPNRENPIIFYIMASYPLSRMNEPCYFSPSMFSAN